MPPYSIIKTENAGCLVEVVERVRKLGLQLLASAAVVDDDQEDKLPGYATE